MCCVVDTPCLLVNAFIAVAPKRSTVSFEELQTAVQKVSASIAKYDAIVSWDKSHLQAALYNYHDLFQRKNYQISMAEGSDTFFSRNYVDKVFNRSLSSSLVTTIQDTFKAQLSK